MFNSPRPRAGDEGLRACASRFGDGPDLSQVATYNSGLACVEAVERNPCQLLSNVLNVDTQSGRAFFQGRPGWSLCKRPRSAATAGLRSRRPGEIQRSDSCSWAGNRSADLRNELKIVEIDLNGRDRLDFGTVRPRVQIPGPRPKSEFKVLRACGFAVGLLCTVVVEPTRSTRMPARAGILGGKGPLEVGQVVALVLQHLLHRLAQ